jgi:hypothetical protein
MRRFGVRIPTRSQKAPSKFKFEGVFYWIKWL